ncbi:MAG: ComF family protein, partial [Elusimicrobia bacterium]|nr:ComF family protein [Elusimicrobiota bacterium]
MFRKLLDLLLPVPCPCCGGVLASTAISHICESCQKSLEIINSMGCSYCGRPIKSGVFCRRCKGRSTPLDGFYITGIYEGKMRELIINFKFNDARYLTKTLAELAVETIVSAGISDDYYLIPVPLHPKRERERGYNQSALLVKHIAHLTGMRADYRLIKRRKNTIPQTSLGKKERSLNLKGAFT